MFAYAHLNIAAKVDAGIRMFVSAWEVVHYRNAERGCVFVKKVVDASLPLVFLTGVCKVANYNSFAFCKVAAFAQVP